MSQRVSGDLSVSTCSKGEIVVPSAGATARREGRPLGQAEHRPPPPNPAATHMRLVIFACFILSLMLEAEDGALAQRYAEVDQTRIWCAKCLATRPKLWKSGNFQALHDEAKAHVAHSLCACLALDRSRTGQRAPDGARARFPLLAARARARAACLTYGPPCSFPPWCARAARRGKLGTHPEAAPGEAPNLAPSARNGRLPWELRLSLIHI